MDMLQAPPLSHSRRRSVDVGGLSLALGSQGLGQGWVGWDESEIDTEEQRLLCVTLFNHPLWYFNPCLLGQFCRTSK